MSDVNWTCDENGKANSSEQFYETVAYVAQRLRDGGASVCLSLDWARTTARTIVSGLASERGFAPAPPAGEALWEGPANEIIIQHVADPFSHADAGLESLHALARIDGRRRVRIVSAEERS